MEYPGPRAHGVSKFPASSQQTRSLGLTGVQMLAKLHDTIERVLANAITPGHAVALLNYPNHGNVGDAAIWLGTRRILKRLGCRVAYSSNWHCFNGDALRRALPEGPVLLNGGGNFGDLYAGQQSLRERVLVELRDRNIVQLPQSIHFRDPANLDRVRRLVGEHGRVTLMLREERSLQFARKQFDAQIIGCPDMAFGLGPLDRPSPPEVDVIWLHRRLGDPEFLDHGEPPCSARIRRIEWLEGIAESEAHWRGLAGFALRINRALRSRCAHSEKWARRAWRPLAATFSPTATCWMERGLGILSSARVVVTDKLHGHILSLLLGIPHVVLDNSYGKVRSTIETWTGTSPLVVWAEDAPTALARAEELLGERVS
jgi:exopolysaccharide biosynthesis predicted pyruvyltransferase EpsI